MSKFKSYKIWKNWHWCNVLFRFKLLFDCKRMVQQVIFKKSCLYVLPFPDKLAINKLFGFSYGLHHNNSARFGWHCVEDHIALFAYCYINGKRQEKFITLVKPEQEYKLMISVSNKKYVFTVFEGKSLIQRTIDKPNNLFKIGYKLWPYFGGNRKAPHTMEILLADE